MQIEIYSDFNPQIVADKTASWGWRLIAGSHAVVAYGAGYRSRETARSAGAKMLGTWAAAASGSRLPLDA